LWVRTGVENAQLFVEFQDSGPGVKDASRVFDPFYTTKPVGKGTGLGLSICYGIISEHGGNILVRNEPQGGATFRIELPLKPKVAAAATPLRQTTSPRTGRILVVDANESVLETVAQLLAEHQHQVMTATSLDEARSLLAAGEFDLVIADWHVAIPSAMKHTTDGEEHGLGSRVLWMVSISGQEQDPRRVLPKNAAILPKPFQPAELLAEVESALLRVDAPVLRG
jgi:two-component system, NtrC family, sensor kinase